VPLPRAISPRCNFSNPKTLLALLLNAILSCTRISHESVAESVACLIKADYHDMQVLKKASWGKKNGGTDEKAITHAIGRRLPQCSTNWLTSSWRRKGVHVNLE
jgi:hypothetical protein